MVNTLIAKLIEYYAGDAKRIQHFIKVHTFAKLIGEMEHLDSNKQYILELAAVLHDIGIKKAEELYGSSDGKYQEELGPDIAKEILVDMKLEQSALDRICYLIGHHHTYSGIDGMDYQILVEADFLVNIYEDNIDKKGALAAYNNIFKTNTGKKMCNSMYSLGE